MRVGTALSPDGRVYGQDVVAADGTLAIRTGAPSANFALYEESTLGTATAKTLYYGHDGKIYAAFSGELIGQFDQNLNFIAIVDPVQIDTSGPRDACSALFQNIDSAGNMYSAVGSTVVAGISQCAPGGHWTGYVASLQDGVLVGMGLNSEDHLIVLQAQSTLTCPCTLTEINPGTKVIVRTATFAPATTGNYTLNLTVGYDDRIYVSINDAAPRVYVLDPTLTPLGTIDVRDSSGKAVLSAFLGADRGGNLYYSVGSGLIKADARGNVLWITGINRRNAIYVANPSLPPPVEESSELTSRPAVVSPVDGTLYFNGINIDGQAIVAKFAGGTYQGDIVLQADLHFQSHSGPVLAVDGGYLITAEAMWNSATGTATTDIQLHDSTGAIAKIVTTPLAAINSLLVGPDHKWYVDAQSQYGGAWASYVIDPATGAAAPAGRTPNAVTPDGNFISFGYSGVVKFTASGTVLWTTNVTTVDSAVVDAQGRVLVSSSNGLSLYDGDGKLLASQPSYGTPHLVGGGDHMYMIQYNRIYQIATE